MPAGFVLFIPSTCSVDDLFDCLLGAANFRECRNVANERELFFGSVGEPCVLTLRANSKGYIDEILEYYVFADDRCTAILADSRVVAVQYRGNKVAIQVLTLVNQLLGAHSFNTCLDNEWGVLLRLSDLISILQKDPQFNWRTTVHKGIDAIAVVKEE